MSACETVIMLDEIVEACIDCIYSNLERTSRYRTKIIEWYTGKYADSKIDVLKELLNDNVKSASEVLRDIEWINGVINEILSEHRPTDIVEIEVNDNKFYIRFP